MESIRVFLFALLLVFSLHSPAQGPVNINSADKETLMAVKGVGEIRAEAIISYRERFGPFQSIEQLLEVEGIGQSTIDANREILTVGSSMTD